MNVLTTSQFNMAVERLSFNDQQNIVRLFNLITRINAKDLAKTLSLNEIIKKDDKQIFVIREHDLRVYLTIENISFVDTAILMDVVRKEEEALILNEEYPIINFAEKRNPEEITSSIEILLMLAFIATFAGLALVYKVQIKDLMERQGIGIFVGVLLIAQIYLVARFLRASINKRKKDKASDKD